MCNSIMSKKQCTYLNKKKYFVLKNANHLSLQQAIIFVTATSKGNDYRSP